MLTKFPCEILVRIFTEVIKDPCEIQYTCKRFYCIYKSLKYRLVPVKIRTEIQLQRVLRQNLALNNLACLYIRDFKRLTSHDFIQIKLLSNLKDIYLTAYTPQFLKLFLNLPKSLKKLAIFIENQSGGFTKYHALKAIERAFERRSSLECLLETLVICSKCRILSKKINNYLWLALYLANTHDLQLHRLHQQQQQRQPQQPRNQTNEQYFNSDIIARIEYYKNKYLKKGLILFGVLLFKAICMVKHSLTFIQFGNIDPFIIFSSPRQLHCPHLKLFAFDNCSFNMLQSWIRSFQLTNSQNHPLVLLLLDNSSQKIMKRQVSIVDNSWEIMDLTGHNIQRIKRELQIRH